MVDGVITIPFPAVPRTGAEVFPAPVVRRQFVSRPFIAGPENTLAAVAVLSVGLGSGFAYNPIVLYGPPGVGKSHLAAGLVSVARQTFVGARIAHVVAVDFAREFVEAIETSSADEFFARYRLLDLLVIEDLHLLANRTAAEEALVCIVDDLMNRDGRLVVTLPSAPGAQSALSPALVSRLTSGLAIPLAQPGLGARQEVLHAAAEGRGVELSSAALRRLAEALDGTVRELQGAIAQIELYGQVNQESSVERFLLDRLANPVGRRLGAAEIAQATARHFGMKVSELQGASRQRHIALARGVAMYLVREHTDVSLAKIGGYFGRRDHTTVLHAWRKIKKLLDGDLEVRRSVEVLRQTLVRS